MAKSNLARDEKVEAAESAESFAPEENLSEAARDIAAAGEVLETERANEFKKNVESELVSDAAIERAMNMARRAEIIENFAETGEIDEKDSERLGNMIAERGWQSVFTELKAGDKVVNFTTPGGAMSIKNLNSTFGEQGTDNIIGARKRILAEVMNKHGLEQLMQSYNAGLFRADSKIDGNKLADVINAATAEVNEKMREAIRAEIPEGKSEQAGFEEIMEILDKKEGGYKMSFGVNEVSEAKADNDFGNVIEAIAGSAQAAQRHRHGDGAHDGYGEVYDEKNILAEVDKTNALREKLAGQKITDKDGITYEVFSRGDDGAYALNKDLLRLVRKGEFKADDASKDVLKQVELYVRSINLFDLVKPFTADEASDGTIADRVATRDKFISREDDGTHHLAENLNQAERGELLDDLKHDAKDARFLSPEFFHKEALGMKDCAYVSIDVLDLGVDALLQFEKDMQTVGNDPSKLREISVKAGDAITERMRDVRTASLQVYEKYFGDSENISAKIGGDEITIAIGGKQDKDKLNNFLIDLRAATGTRVVKTVVGESERHSDTEWGKGGTADQKIMVEHLVALKRAERGGDECKKIEKMLRTARQILENNIEFPVGASAEQKSDAIQREFDKFEISDFGEMVAMERDSGFFMAYRSTNGEVLGLTAKDAKNKLEFAVNKLKEKYGLPA